MTYDLFIYSINQILAVMKYDLDLFIYFFTLLIRYLAVMTYDIYLFY